MTMCIDLTGKPLNSVNTVNASYEWWFDHRLLYIRKKASLVTTLSLKCVKIIPVFLRVFVHRLVQKIAESLDKQEFTKIFTLEL